MRMKCGPDFENCADGFCRQDTAGNTILSSREAAARCSGTLFVRRETQGLYGRGARGGIEDEVVGSWVVSVRWRRTEQELSC